MIKHKEENKNIRIIINNFTSNITNFVNQEEQDEKKEEIEVLEDMKNDMVEIEEIEEDIVSKTEERGSHRKEAEDAELEQELEEELEKDLDINFLN